MQIILTLLILTGLCSAATYTVKAGGGGDYTTIQACANAMANGDTCTVFAGTYNENVTVSAGAVGNYKTISVNGSDTVNAFSFTLNSHTKVIGLTITRPSAPHAGACINIASAATDIFITSNRITQCGEGNSNGGAQIITSNSGGATYVYIQGNTFSYGCGTPAAPDSCNAMQLFGDHYLVENNDISHVLFGANVNSKNTVIRGNTFHDMLQSDCTSAPSCHADILFAEPGPTFPVQNNLWENNIARNLIGTDSKGFLTQADVCGGLCSRVIIRFNQTSHIGAGGLANDRAFPYVKLYNNTWVDTNYNAPLFSGTLFTANNATNGSAINELFYYPYAQSSFNPYATDASTIATYSSGHSLGFCTVSPCNLLGKLYGAGLFTNDPGNIKADPLFVNYASNNFNLAPGSPAINAGSYLTTVAAGDTGSGTSLIVNDAAYFQDGFGITGVNGDCVSVGTVTNHVCVTAVNYSTNTLTLSSGITRSVGNPVWLYSDSAGRIVLTGSAPNIGSSLGPCAIDSIGWCITGLSAIQNNLLGPLTPYGSNPWTFGDLAEKGTADNMAPLALAAAPALGTALPGTVSHTQGSSNITTTANLVSAIGSAQWVAIAWTSVDGTATGRALCPISSVNATTISCTESMNEPDFSGVTAYLLPPPPSVGDCDFQCWTTENPVTAWNYYDVAIGLYRLWIRTGNPTYRTQAQAYADITWQWTLDHGYRRVAPRAASLISQFFRVGEGHTERLPGLYNWIALQIPLWASTATCPACDNRENGYMLWDIALGAKVDTDPMRHAQYCSWLTLYTPGWNTKQAPDGSWPEEAYAVNAQYVAAPKAFAAPFLYPGAPWREAINVKAMQAAYESLNDTSMQGCSSPSLAATTLTSITNAVTWQNNYGRNTTDRGIYYEVNSQSNDQSSVSPATGTVSVNLSSTSVTGVGTNWNSAGYCDGTHFIGFETVHKVYKIASCLDNTHATLTVAFGLYGEVSNLSGSNYGIAPIASTVCHSSATQCNNGAGDRNLTRTVCGGMAWLYNQTLNATYKTWTDECLSAQLGGPTAGLNTAANMNTFVLPCSGAACDGYIADTWAAAANCNFTSPPFTPPCMFGNPGAANQTVLGKNYGEAFGAPGIDNALAWRLVPGTPTCSPRTGLATPNVLDIQYQVNMALGTVACTNSITQTGTCTVVDVQRVINASLGQGCVIGTTTTSDDEFVGPFPSWTNLVTSYGTSNAAIQTALNELGTPGRSHVLYVPCGTYTITGLTITSKQGISVLGADPSCVTFQLSGAGPLLHVNGVNYSKFSRITFDGGGSTSAILIEQANNSGAFFDTGNEYADDVFRNAGTGFRCGWMVNGCSEISILRDQFTNITHAGVFIGNFNALDVWVRYSVFNGCGVAVGNYDGTNVGAGNFHIYNSILKNSTLYDVGIANTTPFSFRDSYFSSSPYAIFGAGTGNPAPMTIGSNTFINQTTQAINMGNQGPVLLMDNATLQASATLPSAFISSDGIAVSNQFTLGPSPIAAGNRLFETGTQIVSSGSINTTEPTLPGVQPNLNRMVFEVAAGASAAVIQSAINSAVALNGSRPVVHLPEGTYSINVPLSIPANSDLQLTGDGFFATLLNWTGTAGTGPVVLIGGPSHATLRDFRVNAGLQADAIGVYGIDQSGSRVFLHGAQMAADGLAANSNLFYDGLDNAVLDIEDTGHSATSGVGVNVTGGPLASVGTTVPGMVRFFSTSGGDETLPYSVSNGGTLLVRDDWSETAGPAFANISGRALVTFDGVHAFLSGNTGQATPGIAISNLIGKVSILTSNPQDRTVISGNGTNTQVLQAGGNQACVVINPYFIDNTSPAGTSGILNDRACTTTVPGTGSVPTTNAGNNGTTFVTSMLAQTRAAHQVPLTTLSNSVTDLRMYRVWTNRGTNGIHLTSVRANLH